MAQPYIQNHTQREGEASGIPKPTRRRVLRRFLYGGLAATFGGAGYVFGVEPVWVETIQKLMPIGNLPKAFNGFRLVQISDLHIGNEVPYEYLSKCIFEVNQRNPDLIVVTGDIVHHGQNQWNDAAGTLLSSLSARHGVVAVLGNHDWSAYSAGQGIDWWADRVATALRSKGTTVLRNEAIRLHREGADLHIVGLDDYWGDRFNPQTAFSDVPPAAPCIALVHQPDAFPELLDTPACWILAGHTHGGQVNLPLYGPPILPTRYKQFVAGHYQLSGKNLYVNRGLGWLKRVRFNARPEITEFVLRQV